LSSSHDVPSSSVRQSIIIVIITPVVVTLCFVAITHITPQQTMLRMGEGLQSKWIE